MKTWLRIDELSCAIGGTQILRNISLEAGRGEFIGLLGNNGAGKSTLLDIMAGLRQPDAGGMTLDGIPVARLDATARSRMICHLPQGVRGELPFTVEQVVLMGRYPHADRWMESAADAAAVDAALARSGCASLRSRRFSSLSGGERQRALLAACLAQSAQLLLMDEPSTYLDLHHQLQCFELLGEEARRGALSIAVTHDINLALTHCSRLVILNRGAIEYDMKTAEVRGKPEWLRGFSERLRFETSTDGLSWVAYR